MFETDYVERRAALVPYLAEHNLGALLVSAPSNIRYLTGFTGSNGLVLLSTGETILFTDPRYAIQAAQETGCAVAVERGPLTPAVLRTIVRKRWKRIGFERSRVSYDLWRTLEDGVPSGARLLGVSGQIEINRMVKSPAEIELIRRSVQTASKAFAAAVKKVRPGISEQALAAEIDYQMRKRGAEQPAFETIVAFGARSALPHAKPSANCLSPNQLLLIDMGAAQDGYASDMTRVLHLDSPGRKVRQLYRAVLEAQLEAIDAVRPGITAGHIDRKARQVLRAHGLEQAFVHSTGHGLGLEIHELPRLGRQDGTPLREGMAITVEPGAYIEGFGGIRIEDTVIVTRSGCEVLTPTSKDLVAL